MLEFFGGYDESVPRESEKGGKVSAGPPEHLMMRSQMIEVYRE